VKFDQLYNVAASKNFDELEAPTLYKQINGGSYVQVDVNDAGRSLLTPIFFYTGNDSWVEKYLIADKLTRNDAYRQYIYSTPAGYYDNTKTLMNGNASPWIKDEFISKYVVNKANLFGSNDADNFRNPSYKNTIIKSPITGAPRNWLSRIYVENGNIYMDRNTLESGHNQFYVKNSGPDNYFTKQVTNLPVNPTLATYIKLYNDGSIAMHRTSDGYKLWSTQNDAGAKVTYGRKCGVTLLLKDDSIHIFTGSNFRYSWKYYPFSSSNSTNASLGYGGDFKNSWNIIGFINGTYNLPPVDVDTNYKPTLTEVCANCPWLDSSDLSNEPGHVIPLNSARACFTLGYNYFPGKKLVALGQDPRQEYFYDPKKKCNFNYGC